MISNHKSRISLALAFFLAVVLSGCAGQITKIDQENRAKNQQIALASGKRVFDAGQKEIMKAIITAFSDMNLTVVAIDRELGFISSEGVSLMPEREKEVLEKQSFPRLCKEGYMMFCGAKYIPGTIGVKVAANVFEKSEETVAVKLGITTENRAPVTPQQAQMHGVMNHMYPEWTQVLYDELWKQIDRALFIQRETQ